ncbi:hypothetical protein K438DRAFT_1841834 [Mycena galopus ATCC 62051]|nr:hypothetical protein K438DRAFT_1841834 [Mycena galopus ATCC 62051]
MNRVPQLLRRISREARHSRADAWTRLSTLNPTKLTPKDIFNPGGEPLHVFFDNIYPDVVLPYRHPDTSFPGVSATVFCFTPFSSSIRLRQVATGRDVTFENGLPWQIMACQMAVYDTYEGLRKKLIADGLWTTEDHAAVFDSWKDRRALFPERTLFALGQEFPLSLDANLTLTMAGKGEHRNFALRVLAADDRPCGHSDKYRWVWEGTEIPWGDDSPLRWPFSGDTIARFEPSPLPEHTSPSGSPTALCIRLLRQLTPIHRLIYAYPGPTPAVGELLPAPIDALPEEAVRPWTYPLTNNANSRALRLLMP